jgi:hypothetical protein
MPVYTTVVMTNSRQLATIATMWRSIRVLGPVQSFVLASTSAAVIAIPLTIWSISHESGLLRDLFWPHELAPYIEFSLLLLGLMPILLGYFHLGRLGALVALAVGFGITWLMSVCGVMCFVYLGRKWLSSVAYAFCVVLLYSLLFWLHLRAIRSLSIRDAQQKMRLTNADVLL